MTVNNNPGFSAGAATIEAALAISIIVTVAVAALFQPLRDRARRLANLLVYGKRATPYDLLSEFSERVGDAYADDDVLPRNIVR